MSRAANQRTQPAARGPFLSIYSTSSPTGFHLMQSTARILENIGFSASTPECLTTLASMMKLYFDTLSLEAKAAAEHAGRSEVNVKDVAVALKKSGVNASELFDYVRQVGSFPPPTQLPRMPVAELAAEAPIMEQAVFKLEELSAPNGTSKVQENRDSAEREHTQQLADSRPKKGGGGRRPFPDFFASKADDLGIAVAPPRIEPECFLSPVPLTDESLPTISCLSPPLLTAAAPASTAEDDGVVVAAQEAVKESPLRAQHPTPADPNASTAYEPLPPDQQRQEDILEEGVQRERLLMKLPKLKLKKHRRHRERRDEEGVKTEAEALRVEDAQETPTILQSSSIPSLDDETQSIQVPKEEEFTTTASTEASIVLPPPTAETVPKLVFRRPVAVEVDEPSRRSHKKEKKAKRKRSEQSRKAEKDPKGPKTPPPPTTPPPAQQEAAEGGEPVAEFSAQAAQAEEPELKPKIMLTIKIGQQPQRTPSREDLPSAQTSTQSYDDLVPPPKKVRSEEAELDESTGEPSTPTPSCETKVTVETARAPSQRPSETLPPIETVDRAPAPNSAKRKASKQPIPAGSSKLAAGRKPPPPKIKLAPVKKGAAKKVPTTAERIAKKSTSSTLTSVGSKKTPAKCIKRSAVAKRKKTTKKGKARNEEEEGDSVCPVCSVAYTDDADAEWICCDECDKWYHWHCVGILFEPPKEKKWYCPKCKKDK